MIGPWAWVWMLVWLSALLFIVWLIVRSPKRTGPEDALAILGTRFARGEISQQEFERARDALLADRMEVTR